MPSIIINQWRQRCLANAATRDKRMKERKKRNNERMKERERERERSSKQKIL